ncbi:hypothetical protein JOB18_038138 [Solea senegalensis]|uniref:Uncharacterized protein n=1 Tax=Solea senegalensis TaxID=28829 RepID=A0AAV6PW87_SOLSE|nr:hypothetical protein JOB18_038138 [Solea senegalensis]
MAGLQHSSFRRTSPQTVVHCYSDGVYRYDCKREDVNNTGHERRSSAFQKLHREDTAPSVRPSVTTDAAPSMVDCSNGFIAKCREDDTFPDFHNYHCVIRQQALCA